MWMWNDQADWISKYHPTAAAPSFYVYVLEVQYFSLAFLGIYRKRTWLTLEKIKNKSDIMP